MTQSVYSGPGSWASGHDSERFFEELVSCADDAIMAMDLQGRVTVWNAGCERLFGWAAAEIQGKDLSVVVPKDRQDEITRVLNAFDGTSEAAAVETLRLTRDGNLIPVACRISPMRDRNGRVYGACAVVRDTRREIALRQELQQARQEAEARFLQSVVAQMTMDTTGVITRVNPAMCRLSGYSESDLLGNQVTDFSTGEEHVQAVQNFPAFVAGTVDKIQLDRQIPHADGSIIDTRITVFPIRDPDSTEVVRLEVMLEDVTAEQAARRELQQREAKWQSLAANSADVAVLANADATVQFVSASVQQRLGYTPEMLLGAVGFDFVHPEDEPAVRAFWKDMAANPGSTTTFEARLRHADGTWHWVEQSATNRLDDPSIGAVVVNITDISDRKRAESVLLELAGLDTLTGLASRAPLLAALETAFAEGRAPQTAVLVLDLARFKLVNDTHGQRAGDAVLTEVAARLLSVTGDRDVVARLGGDRFAVMLHADDMGTVRTTISRIERSISAPIDVHAAIIQVTTRIGAAVGPASDAGALLTAAEQALQTARRGAVDSVAIVSGQSPSVAIARARLIEDLRRGLHQGELVVHFQPVMSLAHGVIAAAEALVRWQHPERGLLAPADFIDAAEESGLIIDLGQQVLKAACRAAARWAQLDTDGAPFHVAVNLSAKQLTATNIVDVVRENLAASGALGSNLMLEVTESAVMADVDAAGRTLAQLRDLGLSLAIDDFGTGYSSLTYLKRFPVTALKIDRSFVSGLGQNSDDAAIVASTIGLSRAMGLACIAEGVETDEQRLVLQALGCDYAQGYLWSTALDVGGFDRWVRGRSQSPVRRASDLGETSVAPSPRPAPDPATDADELLVRIRDLQIRGASLHSIAAALNADGLVTERGKRWHAQTVARFLTTRRLR